MRQVAGHSEFLMVLVLFVALRLLTLLLYTPASFLTSGFLMHGYYYDMAAYTDQGKFPYVHFWFEYPPVFTYLSVAIYRLTMWGGESFDYFNRLLTFAVLPFEMLTLVNLYRIARRVYDSATAVRVAWIYSLLAIPAYYWWHGPDPILVALTLQALYWLLLERWKASAVSLGIAIATKFTPVFLLGTLWRFATNWRQRITVTVVVIAVVLLIYMPFLVLSPTFTWASILSLANVSSWETIWALMDGNLVYGNVGSLEEHFDPMRATIPVYNPPLIPLWVTLVLFGVLFYFVYSRPLHRANPRNLLLFTGLALMLFLLWSKGWSPQWATLVLPIWLLVYPNWRGVLLTLTLSFADLLDWPLTLSLNSPPLYIVGVLVRTGLFLLVAIDLYSELIGKATNPPARSDPV